MRIEKVQVVALEEGFKVDELNMNLLRGRTYTFNKQDFDASISLKQGVRMGKIRAIPFHENAGVVKEEVVFESEFDRQVISLLKSIDERLKILAEKRPETRVVEVREGLEIESSTKKEKPDNVFIPSFRSKNLKKNFLDKDQETLEGTSHEIKKALKKLGKKK